MSGLSFLFVISIITSHIYYNLLIRITYYLSAVWLGTFLNLLFFFLLNRLIIAVSQVINIAIDYRVLHIVVLIVCLSYSVYAIISGKLLKLKKIRVEINKLPEYWINKKAVLITDVHLGAIYGNVYLRKLVSKINSLSPDIIIIAGDLFDGSKGDNKAFIQLLNKLKSEHGVIFVMGNHESYMNPEKLNDITSQLNFNILNNKMLNINGLQFVGINPYTKDRKQGLINISKELDKNFPAILINHEPLNISYAKSIGADLMLSGHTHQGQFFPFSFFTGLIYKKYHYGHNIEENFQTYTSSGAGTWGPPMRSFSSSEVVLIELDLNHHIHKE
ncbi:metallophosphoesterase [Bacteroidota bacterium]